MRNLGAAVLLAAALAAGPSIAQTVGQLSYDQVLAPSAVRAVQDRLRQMGVYGGAVDGVWGNDSLMALQQFQRSHDLQVTGQLNQATAALLNLNPGDLLAATAPVPPARPLTSAEIRNLEIRLRNLGYYQGPIDGVWGPSMQDALNRFQQASGIQASGQLNLPTVTAMGLNPNDLSQPVQ